MNALDKRWIPRLSKDGRVYCSPACGCGCTRAAYDAARVRANRLAGQLGEGWEPNVWENGGWNYEVIKGPMTVRPRTSRRQTFYGAEFRVPETEAMVGNTVIQCFSEDHLNPEDAVREAFTKACGIVTAITKQMMILNT